MSDAQLLARIDENVKYLRERFDDHKRAFDMHVIKDDKIVQDFIRPLWEESQQRKGGEKSNRIVAFAGGFFINVIIAGATAYAAVKSIVAIK